MKEKDESLNGKPVIVQDKSHPHNRAVGKVVSCDLLGLIGEYGYKVKPDDYSGDFYVMDRNHLVIIK